MISNLFRTKFRKTFVQEKMKGDYFIYTERVRAVNPKLAEVWL